MKYFRKCIRRIAWLPWRGIAVFRSFYFLKFRPQLTRGLAVQSSVKCQVAQKTYFTGHGIVKLGEGVIFGFKPGGYFRGNCIEFTLRKGGLIEVGANTFFNNNVYISASRRVSIGADCLIGHNCEFSDSDGHGIHPLERRSSLGIIEETIIGDNVWLGNGCKVLRGSRIGRNCIVAAGAVVKGEFSDNSILGGVPAKVIRTIDAIDEGNS